MCYVCKDDPISQEENLSSVQNAQGTGSGNEYSDQSYWDERYKTTVTTLFDW